MLGGRELFLSQYPSCARSLGLGGFWEWRVCVHARVRVCVYGCVQVHVDLSPNAKDREEEQVLSNAKGCSGSAQPWRRFGMTEEGHGAPLTSLIPCLGVEGE